MRKSSITPADNVKRVGGKGVTLPKEKIFVEVGIRRMTNGR